MRYLVFPKNYETLKASGQFVYNPLAITDSWRWSDAPQGYTILRTDFDGRDAKHPSLLTHWLFDENGRPQRFTYRYLTPQGKPTKGNILFEEDGLLNSWRTPENEYTQSHLAHQPLLWGTAVGIAWYLFQKSPSPTTAFLGDVPFVGSINCDLTQNALQIEGQMVTIGGQAISYETDENGWLNAISWADGLTATGRRNIFR